MFLHGWLKFWTWLSESFLNFEELKLTNFTRCHMDTNIKNDSFHRYFTQKLARKMLRKISLLLNTLK